MEIIILGTWLISGILCSVVASSKGRSGADWLIIGLLTGIFGLIAIAGMPVLAADRPTTPHGPRRGDFLVVITAVAVLGLAYGYTLVADELKCWLKGAEYMAASGLVCR